MSTSCWAAIVALDILVGAVGQSAGAGVAQAAPPKEAKGNVVAACLSATNDEVWLAKTGGLWTQGDHYGHYRVLVLRKGIEHAIDQVQVQWLEADDKANVRHARTCINLESPGLKGYVTDVSFKKVDNNRTAIGIDIEMKAMYDVVLREVYLVSAKAEVRRVVEGKYVDLD